MSFIITVVCLFTAFDLIYTIFQYMLYKPDYRKETKLIVVQSIIIVLLVFLHLYPNYISLDSYINVIALAAYSIGAFAYFFLFISCLICLSNALGEALIKEATNGSQKTPITIIKHKKESSWKTTYGINMFVTAAVVLISCFYCLFPQLILRVNGFDTPIIIVIVAMSFLEVAVAIYAGHDLIYQNNLRWFLRTSPYCITGLAFALYAHYLITTNCGSPFRQNDSLANAILSFVTITYFGQVFNERFCKKQDDQAKRKEPLTHRYQTREK